jgi:hypothetical protein
VAATTVALVAGLAAGAKFLVETGDEALTDNPQRVEVRQVIVFNRLMANDSVDGQLQQTKASMPHLDISVLNPDSDPALLTGAAITVLDSAHLALCEYGIGDAVSVSWKYAVELPVLPLRSETIVARALHQEVPPGEVDRFKLFFRVPPSGLDSYVYALRIALVADDGEEPADAGGVVIGLPDAILPGELVLPFGPRPFDVTDAEDRLMSTWCARRNLAELRRVLRQPGRRSASMSALAELHPARWWQDFADPRPAKAAARALLRRPDLGEAPVLAMFAAERTDDPSFQSRVRRRAAAAMVEQARHWLRMEDSYAPRSALLAARHAIRILPSPEARKLLAQAEARWQVSKPESAIGWGD